MNCRQCPRNCGTLREENRPETFGYCGVPVLPKVARAALHFWEEPCISGEEGSGTVFFRAAICSVFTARTRALRRAGAEK